MTKAEIKKYDDLWRDEVKVRAGFRCEMCGNDARALNSHHFFGRANRGLRFHLPNGFCLCVTHHFYAESNPNFTFWAIKKRGQDWFDQLNLLNNITKRNISNDLLILDSLKKT